ncbi:MAG: hypothetical protein HY329_04565, partial [Chloroflexi bacterium]|nr:hypothetical protein [Chloroflexota bacterium]
MSTQEEQGGLPNWRRATGAMAAVSLIAYVGFSFVNPFLPLYFGELGVGGTSAIALWSGVALGIAPLSAAI